MELTRCADHETADLVETYLGALTSASDLINWGRQSYNLPYMMEIIAMSQRDRGTLNCCPAGAYALYLVDAATRTYLAGEGD